MPLWLSVCSHPLCPDELHPAHVDKPSLPEPVLRQYNNYTIYAPEMVRKKKTDSDGETSKPERYKQQPTILEKVQIYLA